MLTDTSRWSHARGNAVVPSRWQATRRQALAHTLMVERFGRPQQDRTEAARDSGPDDSGGINSAGRPDGRSDPRPPRRKYRGWTLASRRSQ